MTRPEFNQILDRYFKGEATEQEKRIVEKFYDKIQGQERDVIHRSAQEKEKLKQEMLNAILKSYAFSHRKKAAPVNFNWRIAASIALFVCLGGLLIYFIQFTPEKQISYITKSTEKGQRATVTLSDGTKVWLNAGSSISYPENFKEDSRNIILTGEAFFEVTKDPSRPFMVESSDVMTTVLGTSFNINAYSKENITITVSTGKVQVSPLEPGGDSPEHNSAILIPNQQAVFDVTSETFEVENVDPSTYLAWKNSTLKFEMVPFYEVVRTLERWYDVDIDLENKLSNNCMVRASYKSENLENVLSGLKLLVNFEYQFISKDKLKIVGKGCEN